MQHLKNLSHIIKRHTLSHAHTHTGSYTRPRRRGRDERYAIERLCDSRVPGSYSQPHRQLYAPEAPRAAGCLLETALLHHNAARYRAAVEAYLRAYT